MTKPSWNRINSAIQPASCTKDQIQGCTLNCNPIVNNCNGDYLYSTVQMGQTKVIENKARTYLQPYYDNGVLGNVYLLAGQQVNIAGTQTCPVLLLPE